MTLTLAFYVGRGNWVDRAIRHATGAAYSHVELLAPYEGRRTKTMRAISSSPRDGGVRVKEMTFHPARWSFVDLHPWHRAWPFERAAQHLGARYDWRAIAFTHALGLGGQNPRRFTCSELIASALGLWHPQRITPGDLYDQIFIANQAYLKGRLTGLQGPS